MATREEYCNILEKMYNNHSIYVGGANGEKVRSMDLDKYRKCENIYGGTEEEINKNIARDLRFVAKCVENGYNMDDSQACDCSGLEVSALREAGIIGKNDDYRARDFQAMSDPVSLTDLLPGDFVFNKMNASSHMATYVGKDRVIESRGRDYGVVKRKLSAGSWVIGGRKDWFSDKIPPLTRNLYYVEGDRMKGEDVRMCKEQLCSKGYLKSKYVDNIFGKHCDKSVRKFQEQNNLVVDGIVGPKTWTKLFL